MFLRKNGGSEKIRISFAYPRPLKKKKKNVPPPPVEFQQMLSLHLKGHKGRRQIGSQA